jgi:hypothetical protein
LVTPQPDASGANSGANQTQPTEQAYSRYLTESAEGRTLYQAFKRAPQEDAAPASTVTAPTPEPTPSYRRLMLKGEELRKSDPKLTSAQAFSKAYEAPENRDLVAAAKRERTEQYAATEHVAEMRQREASRVA